MFSKDTFYKRTLSEKIILRKEKFDKKEKCL